MHQFSAVDYFDHAIPYRGLFLVNEIQILRSNN